MKLKKSFIAIAATMTGAGVLAVAPGLSAADYSSSVSGEIRVEAVTSETGNDDAVHTTAFGGEDDDSTTGGDTYLQWNHRVEGDNGVGTGFIRFSGDGDIRINVESTAELGDFQGDLKAEWERKGFEGDTTGLRDNFAKLAHTPSGVYYKIGLEEWLGNEKGYTSDFGSQTKTLARLGDRFAAHALGWGNDAFDVALLIQRGTVSKTSHIADAPWGVNTGRLRTEGTPADPAATVEGFGVKFAYNAGIADVALNYGTATADHATNGEDTVNVLEAQLNLNLEVVNLFLNYANAEQERGAATLEDTGWNLGVSVPLGAADLIVAYGAREEESWTGTDAVKNGESTGYDVIFATNQDPLKVHLVYSALDHDTDTQDKTQYGVSLRFTF